MSRPVMIDAATTLARLSCDEQTARRLADCLDTHWDAEDMACAAFENENGTWQLAIHVRHNPDEDALRALVRREAGEDASDALVIEQVPAKDWVKESLAGLKPVRAGRFLVHGAHDRAKARSNDLGIEIEAARAFGTGHHGTTRGCLLALDALAKRRRFRRVLDVGTGSGVLAIAAAKVFRCHTTASDIDGIAMASARANARLNHAPSMRFVRGASVEMNAITRAAPYDLIFANILLCPLTRMASALGRLVAPDARVVLSGLLPAHENAALTIYGVQGLALERRLRLDGWVTLVLKHG